MNQGEIVVSLRLENGKFTSSLRSSEGDIKTFTRNVDGITERSTSNGRASWLKLGAVIGVVSAIASTAVSKAFSVVSDSIQGAVERVDTLNNFPRIMRNFGVSAKDASRMIKDLDMGVRGLPTSLNDIVQLAEGFVPLTKNTQLATKTALALNNAILAGGAPMQVQSAALEQFRQALSKGVPDLQDWKTVEMAMPAQLQQVTEKLGLGSGALKDYHKNGLGLYQAMKDGKLSMKDFDNALISLNEHGIKGLPNFATQAKNSTQGIATGIKNAHTAVVRGIGNIINAIGSPLISQAIANTGKHFEDIANIISTKVIPVIKDNLPTAFATAKDAFDKTLGTIGALFTGITTDVQKGDWGALGKKLGKAFADGINSLVTNLGGFISKIQDAAAKIDWLGIGIKVGKEAIPFVLGFVAGLLNVDIGKLLKSIWDNLPTIILGALALGFAPAKVLGPIGQLLSKIPLGGPLIKWLFDGVVGASKFFTGKATELVGSFIGSFLRALGISKPLVFSEALATVKLIPQAIGAAAGEIWSRAVAAIGLLGRAIAENGPMPVIQGFNIIRQHILASVANFGSLIYSKGAALIQGLINGLRAMFGPTSSSLGSLVSNIIGRFGNAGAWLVAAGYRIITGLRNGIVNAIAGVMVYVGGIGSRIAGAVGNLGGRLVNAGAQLIAGLGNGIRNAAGNAIQAVTDTVSGAINQAKALLKIKSPSRVFMEIGGYTMEGFANGIAGSAGLANKAMSDAMGGLQTNFSPSVSGSYNFDASGSLPTVANVNSTSGGGKNYVGTVYISNEVDANRFLAKLNDDSAMYERGLTPTRSF